MAKKITTTEIPAEVSLIPAAFSAPAAFVFPNKEESLKIIQAKKAENSKLSIADVSDKINYELVKTAMDQMKDSRIAFVSAATEAVINPVNKHLSKFKEDLEAVVNEFKAGEKDMRDKKDAIDYEKERLKFEKALAQQKAIEARINNLFVLGAVISNNQYTFPYDDSLVIGSLQLKEFDDEEFGEFLEEVKTAWGVEQDRIAEENRLALLAEQQQEEEAQRNRELAQQNEQQATALNEKRTKLRSKELQMLGFQLGHDGWEKETMPHFIDHSDIEEMSEDRWDSIIADIENYVPPVEVDEPATPTEYFQKPGHEQFLTGAGNNIAEELEIQVDEVVLNTIYEEISFHRQTSPYKEFKISAKSRVRIFPDAFADEAKKGVSVTNEGVLQPRISWIVVK